MKPFEYSVIPAPKRGLKGKGIKGSEAQFANALTKLMNEKAADGWEYQRAETLPSEERQGLRGRTTVFQNMLVFRRPLTEPETVAEPPTEPTVAAPVVTAATVAATASEALVLEAEDEVAPEEPDEMYKKLGEDDERETSAS